MIWIIIIAILIIVLIFKYKSKSINHMGNVIMVTGGVKTGKTTLGVHIADAEYRKVLFGYKIKKFLFPFKEIEKPLIYSNIPLKCEYVKLTDELLLRQKRFAFGSIVFCDEASLIADSQFFRNKDINDRLLVFNKLISQELHGGKLIYSTQAFNDCHYSIKRCLQSFIYVHHLVKWIPFVLVFKCREMLNPENNGNVTTNINDVEQHLKLIICSKRVWKKFDCYAYSKATDGLPVENTIIDNRKAKDLKVNDIVTFNPALAVIYGDHNEIQKEN